MLIIWGPLYTYIKSTSYNKEIVQHRECHHAARASYAHIAPNLATRTRPSTNYVKLVYDIMMSLI